MTVYNLKFTAEVGLTVDVPSGMHPSAALRELGFWPEVQKLLKSRVQDLEPSVWAVADASEKPEFRFEVKQCPLVKIES